MSHNTKGHVCQQLNILLCMLLILRTTSGVGTDRLGHGVVYCGSFVHVEHTFMHGHAVRQSNSLRLLCESPFCKLYTWTYESRLHTKDTPDVLYCKDLAHLDRHINMQLGMNVAHRVQKNIEKVF